MKGLEELAGKYWQGQYEAALAFVHLKRQEEISGDTCKDIKKQNWFVYVRKDKKNLLVNTGKDNKKQNWFVYDWQDKNNWLVNTGKESKKQNWILCTWKDKKN